MSTCIGPLISIEHITQDESRLWKLTLSRDVHSALVSMNQDSTLRRTAVRIYQNGIVVTINEVSLSESSGREVTRFMFGIRRRITLDVLSCNICGADTNVTVKGYGICSVCETFFQQCCALTRGTIHDTVIVNRLRACNPIYLERAVFIYTYVVEVLYGAHDICDRYERDRPTTRTDVHYVTLVEKSYLYSLAIRALAIRSANMELPTELRYAIINLALCSVDVI